LITPRGEKIKLYSASYALLIGISDYEYWDPLVRPVKDVDDIATELRNLDFKVEVKKDLSKSEFEQVMSDFLIKHGQEAGAQVFIYFAGHGYTEEDASGGNIGYVIMRDTPDPTIDPAGFHSKSVSTDYFKTYAKQLKSRHVLFLFDSCFSGTVLNMRGHLDPPEPIRYAISKPVREFLTAGSKDEKVPDESIFKNILGKILRGSIKQPIVDQYLTGEELAFLMKSEVPQYNRRQHPQFGKILDPSLDEGDFVFFLKQEIPDRGTSPPVAEPIDPETTDSNQARTEAELFLLALDNADLTAAYRNFASDLAKTLLTEDQFKANMNCIKFYRLTSTSLYALVSFRITEHQYHSVDLICPSWPDNRTC
jgi:hypothetical protein